MKALAVAGMVKGRHMPIFKIKPAIAPTTLGAMDDCAREVWKALETEGMK